MNVLALGPHVIGPEFARELLRAFLSAHFTGKERHCRRLSKWVCWKRVTAWGSTIRPGIGGEPNARQPTSHDLIRLMIDA